MSEVQLQGTLLLKGSEYYLDDALLVGNVPNYKRLAGWVGKTVVVNVVMIFAASDGLNHIKRVSIDKIRKGKLK